MSKSIPISHPPTPEQEAILKGRGMRDMNGFTHEFKSSSRKDILIIAKSSFGRVIPTW